MNQFSPPPKFTLERTPDYRESYANSIQVQMSVWDFRLGFGIAHQEAGGDFTVNTFQSVYVSPQQAKALWNVLGQNLMQYEQTFGQIALEPRVPVEPHGQVH